MKKALQCIAAALVVSVHALYGQALHPNLERGFASDKAYAIGEIDHVNLFNGNVTVTIPIGGATQISEDLSLELTLTYNSKLWESRPIPAAEITGQATHRLIPERLTNAGFGWLLTLGHLKAPEGQANLDAKTPGWTYQSRDGALHEFKPFLHANDPATEYGYTTDGSYLRLRYESGTAFVEFPNGIYQEFSPWLDGSVTRWRLTATRDRHGNHYTVDYPTPLEWVITDQYGRITTVTFASAPPPPEGTYQANLAAPVKTIALPGFNGRTARYEFTYEAADVRRGYCGQEEEPTDDPGVAVPLLRKIALFHGQTEVASYEAGYDVPSLPPNQLSMEETCRAGTLTSLRLPSRGSIRWTYGIYLMPTNCRSDLNEDRSIGVFSKTYDAASAGEFAGDVDQGTWTYTPALTPEPGTSFQCRNTVYQGGPPSMEMTNTVRSPLGDETVHYFSVWPHIVSDVQLGDYRDFGLPFSRRRVRENNFISTKVCKGSCAFDANVRRTTWVAYERDRNGFEPFLSNRRLLRSVTVDHDDSGNELDAVETVHSNFDGVGHYRTVTTAGDFGEGRKTRVVTTNYNKRDGAVSTDGSLPDTGTYDSATGEGFRLPARWVLDTYTSIVSSDGSTSTRELACFDANTGSLRATRVLAGAAIAANDLLTVYERSSNTALDVDARGFVTTESFYGGDAMPLAPTNKPALCEYVGALAIADRPQPLSYQTRHTYRFGTRATSTPYQRDGATAMPFKTLDLDVDASGLAKVVRDTAGAATTYDYDASGRILSITPPGVATIHYTYAAATDSTRARVTATQVSDSGTLKRELQFDSLGRPVVEVQNVGGQLVSRATTYNAAGWKTSLTEWGSSSATRFANFDAFGRPTKITAPDASVTTLAYTGARALARTRQYRSPAGNASTTTTEKYDPFGRLVTVLEDAGPTSAGVPTGAPVTATYEYDAGDHLTHVTVTPAGGLPQHRDFTYDGRGFMTAERQPELDNGEVRYAFDAQGRVSAKTFPAASSLNLAYEYDAAGRTLTVKSGTPPRLVKELTYGTFGTVLGRLESAKRYNYLPGSDDSFLVTEKYTYHATGMVATRTTNIDKVAGATVTPVRSFVHSRTYTDTGLTATLNYPQCTSNNCGTANRTVTFGYDAGFLSSVPGFIGSISYAPSGMVTRIDHANGISDIIAAPANGLARPASIRFEAQCTPPQVTLEPQDTSVEKDHDVTLVSAASGTAVRYQWSRRAASSTTWSDIPGATGPALTATVTQETLFLLTVTNDCGSDPSREIRVTVFERPAIATQPQSRSANAGETVTLTVTASGTAPLSYRWYRGVKGDTSEPIAAPEGTASAYTTPPLTETASYWVRVANAHGSADSETARVDVRLAAPTGLSATALTADSIRLAWTASPHAAKYRIERKAAGSFIAYQTVNAPAVTFTDLGVEGGKAYVYRVVALDGSGGSASAPSNADFASLHVFSAVAPDTLVTARVFDEIVGGINALRIAAGEGALTWASLVTAPAPAAGVEIQAVYVDALRRHANLARGELEAAPWSFPDAVTPAVSEIKALYITELQAALR